MERGMRDVVQTEDVTLASLFPITLAELRSRAPLARDYPGFFVALEGAALWLEVVDGAKQLSV